MRQPTARPPANLWSGSCHELKKIKKIRAKASNKHDYYIRDSSSNDSDYSVSNDSEQDKIINPTERKDMKKLDHVVTNSIKNKNQYSDAI